MIHHVVRFTLHPAEGCGSMVVGTITCLSLFGHECPEREGCRCSAVASIERMGVAVQWRGAEERRATGGFVDVKKLPSGEYVWKHRAEEWAH